MKISKRIISLLMAAMLVFGLPLSAFASDGGEIRIATAEDWKSFVKNCKLDTWSVGKTVVLDTDLDLGGSFTPVPVFSGTFDGNGHSIHMGSYTSAASDTGVFRYVSEGAVVKNLTVTGTWEPSGGKSAIGGIVGHNSGTIENCMFNGVVDGKNNIGGIAGINENTGVITGCTVRGEIRGEHYTGGVAGQNLGSIIRCTNESSVNTDGAEIAPTLDDIDVTHINNTENLSVYTDTGGITGFSSGLLQGCQNTGEIGYPHVGYNVGGIAGRQSGYLHDCENRGAVYGRKDVGGVVGQMEPYLILKFGKDDLERLSDAFSGLQDIMDGMLDHTETTMDDVSFRLDNISAMSDEARESTDYLVHRTEDYVDDTIMTINDLSARADRFLGDLEDILGTGEDVADDITDALNQLHKSVERLEDAAQAGQDAIDSANSGLTKLDRAVQNYKDAWKDVNQSVQNVIGSVGNWEAMEEALADLQGDVTYLKSAGDGVIRAINNTKNEMGDALDSGSDMASDLNSALSRLERSVEKMQDIQDGLSDMVTDMRWAIRDFREGGAPQFAVPDAEYKEQVDNLLDQTGSIFDEVEQMTDEMGDNGDILISDLRAMNDQMRSIMDIMRDIYEKLLDDGEEEEIYEDISEEVTSSTEGVTENCRNYGKVEGDVDTGGICGAIAVEYDFDPEDDLTRQGDTSLNQHFQTKAVLRGSVNYGTVTGKKDYVGGIAGYMKLGSIYKCEAYGKVTSSDGDYIGGIVGSSDSVVRNSDAKVSLSGGSYTGGIAGYGTDIFDCRAMVELSDAEEAAGAIAGKAEGNVKGNYFVDGDWGGVDDISFAGEAEPMAYEDFIAMEGLPERFRSFYLTYMANGAVVDEVAYTYGEKTDSKPIPEVPKQEGSSGIWEELPETVTFDRVIEAVYTQRSSSIASPQTRGEAMLSILLAEGSFEDGAEITMEPVTAEDVGIADSSKFVEGWKVTLPEDGSITHLMRYCVPEGGGLLKLYLVKDGGAVPLDTQKDGQYLCFNADGTQFTFYAERTPLWHVVAPIAGCVVLVLGVVIFWKRERIKNFVKDKRKKEE